MYGEPIEAVRNGLQTMASALRKDPHALEQAFISLITFETAAKQVVPLTEVYKFQFPELSTGGGTSLGAALKLLAEKADQEVVKSTAEQKGDWKPLVFVLTDGEPTDNLDEGLAEFRKKSWGVVVGCAAGSHANIGVLQKIAGENVVKLDTADSNSITAFFKFVSSSISASSKKVDSGVEAGGMNDLPPPPPEISLVKV
jgi:uncharacterized protein YegL